MPLKYCGHTITIRRMALIGTAKAAVKLGVTKGRVNALITAGRLKAIRVGKSYIIDTKDLAAVKDRKPGRPRSTPAKKK